MQTRTRAAVAVLVAGGSAIVPAGGALGGTTAAGPAPPKLVAGIDLANHLSLTDAHGRTVAHLKSGWYTLTIKDSNADQSFALRGPGINRATDSHFVGAAIWGIQLARGTYTYSSVGRKKISRSFSVE